MEPSPHRHRSLLPHYYSAQSHDGPMGYFMAAKNHKIPTFSRKIIDLRFLSLAVKERFQLQQTFASIDDLWNSSLLSAYGRLC